MLNMGFTAGWLCLAVILVRPLLKRSPKSLTCLLWALVALRLILPFSIDSSLSLIPNAARLPTGVWFGNEEVTNVEMNQSINSAVSSVIEGEIPTIGDESGIELLTAASFVWLAGAALMIGYTIVSYLRVCCRVRGSESEGNEIYTCVRVDSPFILGIIKPKVYIPYDISVVDKEYVLAHELAHLKRLDHLWKPLGFLLLSVYWFNPILWLGYSLFCRDIELACDERVIKTLGTDSKAAYSEALLNCSISRRILRVSPLAFGEVGVKKRIGSVLNYKKPALWAIIAAVIFIAVAVVCFMTDPITDSDGSSLFDENGNMLCDYYVTNAYINERNVSADGGYDYLVHRYYKINGASGFKDLVHYDESLVYYNKWLERETYHSFDVHALYSSFEPYTGDYKSSPYGTPKRIAEAIKIIPSTEIMLSGLFSEEQNITYFCAEILQIKKDRILVSPLDGTIERYIGTELYVSRETAGLGTPAYDLEVGDHIIIMYNGGVYKNGINIRGVHRFELLKRKNESNGTELGVSFLGIYSINKPGSDECTIPANALNGNEFSDGSTPGALPLHIITSPDELEAYIASSVNFSIKTRNTKYLRGYCDEDFFKEKSLITVYLTSPSLSYTYEIKELNIENGKLTLHVAESNSPEIPFHEGLLYYICIEADRDLISSLTEFDVRLIN